MKISIFYSWQSDLPSKTNRYFIEDSIKKSLKEINKDNRVIACIDRDTKDELGSPDIRNSIFQKINHSKFFVCDVSLNESKIPNPNVLIELGYAVKTIGWNKILCLFNTQMGTIEELPFDINHNRVTSYNPNSEGEKKRIANIISINITALLRDGKLYNPIEDHLKKKIDYIVLQIAQNIINIFDFEKSINDARIKKDQLKQKLQSEITVRPTGIYLGMSAANGEVYAVRRLDKCVIIVRETTIGRILLWQNSMTRNSNRMQSSTIMITRSLR